MLIKWLAVPTDIIRGALTSVLYNVYWCMLRHSYQHHKQNATQLKYGLMDMPKTKVCLFKFQIRNRKSAYYFLMHTAIDKSCNSLLIYTKLRRCISTRCLEAARHDAMIYIYIHIYIWQFDLKIIFSIIYYIMIGTSS